jgi:hypothetical protein
MFPIYGIAATGTPDKVGELLDIKGADIRDLNVLNDEHTAGCFATLGSISLAKKIFKEEDCEDKYQYNCWKKVKKPFIFIRGNLVEDGHPNAQAAQALIKYAMRNKDFKIGLSVEGATLKKDGKHLLQTRITKASLTVKPCNPECGIWPINDLMKSWGDVTLPDVYKNSESRKSFKEMPSDQQRLLAKSEIIKKSTELIKSGGDLGSVGMVKCWNCGEAKMFMKSRLPNHCTACKSPFSMHDLFQAVE